MCRLLGFSLKEKVKKDSLTEIISLARDLLKDQRDGFGYALSGGDVEGIHSLRLCSGSWLEYGHEPQDEWGDVTRKYDEVKGTLADCTAGIFHGRTSTNSLGIANTHPFVNDELALAHNGIVTYSGKKRKKRGVCDSEDLFNTFTIGQGWSELSKHYSGYAGLLILRPFGVVTLYRDETPALYVSKIKGGVVFGTSSSDVANFGKLVGGGAIPNTPWSLKANIATTLREGFIIQKKRVKPMKRQTYAEKDQLSLGYDYSYRTTTKKNEENADGNAEGIKRFSLEEACAEVGGADGTKRFNDDEYNDAYHSGYEDALAGLPQQPAGVSELYQSGYAEGYADALEGIPKEGTTCEN